MESFKTHFERESRMTAMTLAITIATTTTSRSTAATITIMTLFMSAKISKDVKSKAAMSTKPKMRN